MSSEHGAIEKVSTASDQFIWSSVDDCGEAPDFRILENALRLTIEGCRGSCDHLSGLGSHLGEGRVSVDHNGIV